jgi:PAT family beta-lactamase induction signal transducer AmpG
MDRFTYLPMGRRRIWLIGAQFLMSAGFIGAAMLNPGPTDYAVLVVVTMLVMTGAATQDVAVDGLAVDVLPEKEQGTASGFMFGGQAFGMASAGAAAGAGLQYLGSQTTFLLFIPVLMIPTVYAIVMREHRGEKCLPWNEGQASETSLATFTPKYFGMDGQLMITLRSLVKGSSLWFVLTQSLARTAGGIITPLVPILGTSFLMLSTTEYTSTQGTVDLAMAFVGLAMGSWLTLKLGARWASVSVQLMLLLLMLFLILGQEFWIQFPVFLFVMVCWSLFVLLNSICSNPIRMQLSDKRVGATQFTIYNSLANLPVALGAWMLGQLGGSDNLQLTLGVAASLWLAAALGYALLRMPKVVEPEHPEHIEDAIGGEIPAKVD